MTTSTSKPSTSLFEEAKQIFKQLSQHAQQNTALWVLLASIAIMYVPTFWNLITTGMWTDAENGHGPIIFAVSTWLLWKRWHEVSISAYSPAPAIGWLCLIVASVLYVPSRALDINYIETASYMIALTGVVLMIGGFPLVKALRFPLIFMLFMVPLPNFISSVISHFLKMNVSIVAADVLAWLDYPIARSGIVLQIGQYQLLVADACAGMHTLFMLEALGVLYLNLVKHTSMLRNIMLPILIIPISFFANVVRVLVLALITYYWGNDAGQGFLHGFAGMILFLVGLFTMMGTDSLLRMFSNYLSKKKASSSPSAAIPLRTKV
ncbi:MAG TPA: exosortase B [Methylophilaceae bacterium]|jgi:exosortase B